MRPGWKVEVSIARPAIAIVGLRWLDIVGESGPSGGLGLEWLGRGCDEGKPAHLVRRFEMPEGISTPPAYESCRFGRPTPARLVFQSKLKD